MINLKMVLRDISRSGLISRIREDKLGYFEGQGELIVELDHTELGIATDLAAPPDTIMLDGVRYVPERPNAPRLLLDRVSELTH